MKNIIAIAVICCLAAGGCQHGIPDATSQQRNDPPNLPKGHVGSVALEEVLPELPAISPSPAAPHKYTPTPFPSPTPSARVTERPKTIPPAKQNQTSPVKAAPKQQRQYDATAKSNIFVFHGHPNKKQIALTFDDAPDNRFTPQVLSILKRYRVKATFFVVGFRVSQYPGVLERIAKDGHVVGNHTYHHPQLNKLSSDRFHEEILRNERTIRPIVGYTPKLVRPPYGAINEDEVRWLGEHHYLVVNWNVDPQDWRGSGKEQIISRVSEQVNPGSIILLHSATGEGGDLSGTVQALPSIIEKLRADGYQLVTLPELLNVTKNK